MLGIVIDVRDKRLINRFYFYFFKIFILIEIIGI